MLCEKKAVFRYYEKTVKKKKKRMGTKVIPPMESP